jgi:hypothetical protein
MHARAQQHGAVGDHPLGKRHSCRQMRMGAGGRALAGLWSVCVLLS